MMLLFISLKLHQVFSIQIQSRSEQCGDITSQHVVMTTSHKDQDIMTSKGSYFRDAINYHMHNSHPAISLSPPSLRYSVVCRQCVDMKYMQTNTFKPLSSWPS